MSSPFDAPATGRIADMDPVDRMIRQRAAKSLLGTGGSAVFAGLVAQCCNPFLVMSLIAISAGAATFGVPRKMRKSLGEPHLFPANAAFAGQVLGVLGILLGVLSIGRFVLGLVL
jgi:hypothetical protein